MVENNTGNTVVSYPPLPTKFNPPDTAPPAPVDDMAPPAPVDDMAPPAPNGDTAPPAPDELTLESIIKKTYDMHIESGRTPSEARTRIVIKDGFGDDPDLEIANRLVKMGKLSTFDSVEDANDTLGSEVSYYLKPVNTLFGTFKRTDYKAPTFWEGLSSIGNSLNTEKVYTPEQLEIFKQDVLEISAVGESFGVGVVDGFFGLMKLPLMASLYSPEWNEWGRMLGEALPAVGLGEGWGGSKPYFDRISGSTPQQNAIDEIDQLSGSIKSVITGYFGTPHEDWSKYTLSRMTKLTSEMFIPAGPLVRGSKAVTGVIMNPSQAMRNAVSLMNTMNISKSVGKAVVSTRYGAFLPEPSAAVWRKVGTTGTDVNITKGLSRSALELDSAIGAAVTYEGTLALLGSDNEYAELIAMPMLLLGAIITPRSLISRGRVASETGLMPRLMYDFGSVFFKKGEKLEWMNSMFLRARGVSKEKIAKMRENGELESLVIQKRLGPRATKDLQRLRKSMRKLEIDDPGAYEQLRDRMELNIKTYTKLQEVAQEMLGPESKEVVSVYLNNILELAYFDTIQTQSLAVSEGLKFGTKIRLNYTIRKMQTNKDRIYAANVHLLKRIKENVGVLKNDQINAFVDFAEVAQRSIAGKIEDSSDALLNQLLKRRTKAETEAAESFISAQKSLDPDELAYNYTDTSNRQRTAVDDAFFEDKKVIDNLYGSLDLEIELPATDFRNFLLSKLRVGGSDALEGAAPPAVRDAGVLDNLNVSEDEAFDAIRTFAGIDLKGQPLHKIANQLTESGLQGFDEGTVQTLLRQAEDHIGKLRKQADGSDFDYTTIPKDEAIAEFMRIKDTAVQTLIPVNMTIGKLKILMSKIGLEYSKNIGTAKGHALGKYLIRAEAMLDDVPDNLIRNILEYRATRATFKEQYVPRWLKGIGEKLMRPDVGRGERAISSEAIFQTFFEDAKRIGERGKVFVGLLYKLDGTTLRDSADETIKLMKYGLSRNMESMSPQKLNDIISVYGSKGHNLLGKTTEDTLTAWLDRSVKGWNIDKTKIMAEGKRLSVLVNKLMKTRLRYISGSGFDNLSKSADPSAFFNTKSVVVKTHKMTPEDAARFSDLQVAVKKGEFGDPVSAQEKLDVMIGKTVKPGEIAMTPYEFLRRETNDFSSDVGKEMLESIRNMYAHDIIYSSVKPSGKKLIGLVKDSDGNTIPSMEEIIDYGTLQRKLDESKEIREKIFSSETNRAFETVIDNTRVLAKSTEPSVTVMGLARPLQTSSLMARGFAIARGVLSLRYFAGELTIQGIRLNYIHMMNELLSDPDAVFAISRMVDEIPNYKKMNYKMGLETMAKFLGMNATDLAGISEEDYTSLVENGTITAKGFDDASRQGGLREIDNKLKKKSRKKASEGLSKLMETYG